MTVSSERLAKGNQAEEAFQNMAEERGYVVMRHQEGREEFAPISLGSEVLSSPDFSLFSKHNQALVELKAKFQTRFGQYGLDIWRWKQLKRISDSVPIAVIYAIQDTELDTLVCASIERLKRHEDPLNQFGSFQYWNADVFFPINCLWRYLDGES